MKNEKFLRYKKRSRWLLLGGIILVLISPALLTHPALYAWLSLFDKNANIGSAIGGITSPLVSLIGAILVYLSFEQQIEANHIQKKALKKEIIQDRIKNQYDTLDKHLSEIKEEFYQLRYKRHFTVSQINHAEKGQSYGGEEALEAYSDDVEKFGDLVHQIPSNLNME